MSHIRQLGAVTNMRHVACLSLLCGWILCACSSASSGDSSGSGAAVTCDQNCQDERVSYGLDDALWLIWNQNLAGQPSGSQNLTASCPLGGTVQITGTTGVATNGINTVHLTLVLLDCQSAKSSYSLGFTGTVSFDGSFSDNSANSISFKSDGVTYVGSVTYGELIEVEATCAVSLTDTFDGTLSNQGTWLNGQLCGRPVSQ